MENWRETILKEFTPQVARVTVVSDPDSLLSEEIIIHDIQAQGFDLVIYGEPISFRYLYESKYRLLWKTGDPKEIILLLRNENESYYMLPYDVFSQARKLRFSLDRIFPNLNRSIITELDRSFFDTLYQAQFTYSPHQLSENATKDFVLRHVFEIVPETIKMPADLIRNLLRKHYRKLNIPEVLNAWLVHILKKSGRFNDWPLDKIIPDRDAFFAFLQERWPAYLNSLEGDQEENLGEFAATYHPAFSGPSILPFEHDDIRVYIDNLFAEGLLKPIQHLALSQTRIHPRRYPTWIKMGIVSDPEAERQARLQRIIQIIDEEFPSQVARHTDWANLAQLWAEVKVLWYSSPQKKQTYEPFNNKLKLLQQRIDESFPSWLQLRYGALYNLPSAQPVMVDQILKYAAKELQSPDKRIALVVIDGLALDQWVVIRDVLQKQLNGYSFSTNAAFAWIPTLTSVSRQSIFAGKMPLYFPTRIWDTHSEEKLWNQFWSDVGFSENQIYYRLLTGDFTKFDQVREDIYGEHVRMIGLVLDKVDKIMHGMELGTAGMHNQVRQWAEQGGLAALLKYLSDNTFEILITSDHGNIEAIGFGNPKEGATADLKGERARVYPNNTLRKTIKEKHPLAVEWKASGLPKDYYPLLAPDRKAFVQEGKITVCHGGISLEEVIVPFVKVETR